MKKIITIAIISIALFITIPGNAQDIRRFKDIDKEKQSNEGATIDTTNYSYFYKIIDVEGKSKQDIYKAASSWIAHNYKSAKDVIQLNTTDEIVVKGTCLIECGIMFGNTYTRTVEHVLSIKSKDNKVKIILEYGVINLSSDVLHPNYSTISQLVNTKYTRKKDIDILKKSLKDKFENIAILIEDEISSAKKDDW